ncbi:MAG: VOC family protein [Sphaerochaetaceae bacterium]
MKYLWTTIMVTDLEKSLEFYQEVIGLPLKKRFFAGEGKEIAFLGDGETQIELIKDINDNSSVGSGISLGFQVESLDATMKFLSEKGIAIESGPFQPNENIKFFYVLDPNFLKIQFSEEL